MVGYHPLHPSLHFFFKFSTRGGHGGHRGHTHRPLSFLLEVQVADVSQAGTATAGRMPRSTPCTPWLGLAEGCVCAEAPHATARSLAVPLTRTPPPACAHRCAALQRGRRLLCWLSTRPPRGPRCRCGCDAPSNESCVPRTAQLHARTRQRPRGEGALRTASMDLSVRPAAPLCTGRWP